MYNVQCITYYIYFVLYYIYAVYIVESITYCKAYDIFCAVYNMLCCMQYTCNFVVYDMLCICTLCSSRIYRVHVPFPGMEPAGLSISVRSPHWRSRSAAEPPAWLLLQLQLLLQSAQTAPVPGLHKHGEPQPCILSGFLQKGCSYADHLRLLHPRAACGKALPQPPGSSGLAPRSFTGMTTHWLGTVHS